MATSFTFTEHDVQEEFFARGWTDSLPVVPPTPDRVQAMDCWVAAGDVVGTVPERSRNITVEKAAINAVMAGCEPQHFPVVLAGIAAMCDPSLGAIPVTTGGAALCWPLVDRISKL